jgi:hypothetical protein
VPDGIFNSFTHTDTPEAFTLTGISLAVTDVEGRSVVYALLVSVRTLTVADLTSITDAFIEGAWFGIYWCQQYCETDKKSKNRQ